MVMAMIDFDNDFLSGGLVLMILGALLVYLRQIPRTLWSMFKRRYLVVVDIPDTDPAFQWFRVWLEKHTGNKTRGLWTVSTRDVYDDGTSHDREETGRRSLKTSSANRPKTVIAFSPAPGTHVIWRGTKPFVIHRTRRELESIGDLWKTFAETFQVNGFTGREEIASMIEEGRKMCETDDDSGFKIWVGRYTSWHLATDCPGRPIESVILPDGVMDNLIDDIEAFFRMRSWYGERGIPYRRGYLLSGPPGNGKSSVVSAIASHLNLDVYLLPLASRSVTDEGLAELLSEVSRNAIILTEDIDCLFDGRERKEDSGVTLSGFLNCIDGVAASEGRLLFMTTNHPEALDPAMIRPGRVDKRVSFDDATEEQAKELFKYFYKDDSTSHHEDEFASLVMSESHSMASLQEILLRSPHDPEALIAMLSESLVTLEMK